MSRKTRILATLVASAFALTGLAACSSGSSAGDGKGKVYMLNWKPEQEDAFNKIAKIYAKDTGAEIKVVTAASGTYEQTLMSELIKSDAPTLFNINGPTALKIWGDYAADLTNTKFAKDLKDPNLALKDENGRVRGVPAAVEGYGIIYNQEIMDKYFAMPGAKATKMSDINNFAKLKKVADDMQARKNELGIKGVFASSSLQTGEDWRWQTHLSNISLYYEYKDSNVTDKEKAKFKYNKEFKNLFDLYLTDSTVSKKVNTSKSVADSMAEFAQGQAAMVQNGNWAWSQIKDVDGNVVKEDKIKMLPVYTGHKGEEKQGLAVGTEAFMAVNSEVSKADQKATIDFINWLFTTEKGKKFVVEDLGFIAPFKSFSATEIPNDPLAKEIAASMNNKELTTVPWIFTTYPSSQFKDDFGQDLTQYATGNMSWKTVVKKFQDGWIAEKQ